MFSSLFHRQVLLVCAVVIVLLAGCYRRPTSGEVIARVGDAVLTKEEVLRNVDTTRGNLDVQIKSYATSWINSELIYQEAKRHNIEGTSQFQQQLSLLRRDMLVHEFLRRLLYDDTSKITDQQLQQYYVEHKKEFFVREQMLKINAIGFQTREQASEFATTVVRGVPWDSTVAILRRRPTFRKNIVLELSQHYVSQSTLFPIELWKVALTLNPTEPSYPVKTAQGYFVVQVLARYQPGIAAEYELAKDEVRERFIVAESRKRYSQLLETLRRRTIVELMLPAVQQNDTAYSLLK